MLYLVASMASPFPGLVVILWTFVDIRATELILTREARNVTHHYHLISPRDGITWSSGLDFCITTFQNGRLAIMDDVETVESVQRAIQLRKWFWNNNGKFVNELIWLGGRMNKNQSDWAWLGSRDSIPQEAVLASGEGRCLSRSVHGSDGHVLSQRSCVSQMGQFLCSLPAAVCSSHAPNEYQLTSSPTGHCLVVCSSVTKEYTWPEARNYCVLLGGDLAAEDASNWTDYEHSGALWVGAWKQPWQWTNHQDIRYARWMPSYPRDNSDMACLASTVDGWVALKCDTPIKHLLCEEVLTGSNRRPPVPDIHNNALQNTTNTSPSTASADPAKGVHLVNVTSSVDETTKVRNVGSYTEQPETGNQKGREKTQHLTVNSNVVHNHTYTSVITGVCGFLAGALLTVIVVTALGKLTKMKSSIPVSGQPQSHAHSLTDVPVQPQSPVLSLTAIRRLDPNTYAVSPTKDVQCHLSMTKF